MYAVTFHTEGPPHDNGYNLSEIGQQLKERLSPYFAKMFVFTKRTLKQLPNSEDFCNEYPDEMPKNPHGNFVGYFDFKAFLMDYVLKQIPENTILIYYDSNFGKNPFYWETDWFNLENISVKLLKENRSDVFIPYEWHGTYVREHVKTYVIDRFFPNPIQNKFVRGCRLLNATNIVVRNTTFGRQFIKDWYDLVLDKSLVSPKPNPNPDIALKWACADQDVLNCLVYKYILEGKLSWRFPRYGFNKRIISDAHIFEKENPCLKSVKLL